MVKKDLDTIMKGCNGSEEDAIRYIEENMGNDPVTSTELYVQIASRYSPVLGKVLEYSTSQLSNMSMFDDLTGLYNRRFFDATLNKTIAKGGRGEVASLIIADIDHFKLFNDNYGHLAGDTVLESIGDFLKKNVRKSDVACRYGGEELGIILPGTKIEGALDLAYKLNRGIADYNIQFQNESGSNHNLPVNVSLGVDQIKKGDSCNSLFERVDGFLYDAKNNERNCVFGPRELYVPSP